MNKYVEKDAKRAHHRKGLAIFAAIVAVGALVSGATMSLSPWLH